MCVDIRTLPGQTEESVRRRLEIALGQEVEITKLSSAASVGTAADHEWIQNGFAITERLSGRRPLPGGAAYFTDCSILTQAYHNPPTVIRGPSEPEMARKTDEFCYLSKVEFAMEISEIAERWCGI